MRILASRTFLAASIGALTLWNTCSEWSAYDRHFYTIADRNCTALYTTRSPSFILNTLLNLLWQQKFRLTWECVVDCVTNGFCYSSSDAVRKFCVILSWWLSSCRRRTWATTLHREPDMRRYPDPQATTPLVTELLQMPVQGYGTVYRHISEMLTYRTVGSGGH